MLPIALAADHAGLKIKNAIFRYLKSKDIETIDCGTFDDTPVDYVDKGIQACDLLKNNKCEFVILVCGTGIGMSIIANKMKGIRCALCSSVELAKLSREHNDANVLALSGRFIEEHLACEIVKTFINTSFSNELRHATRLMKIKTYENNEEKNEKFED